MANVVSSSIQADKSPPAGPIFVPKHENSEESGGICARKYGWGTCRGIAGRATFSLDETRCLFQLPKRKGLVLLK